MKWRNEERTRGLGRPFQVTMKGGPFDGDSGSTDAETLPEWIYVCLCKNCGKHTAWYFEQHSGGEPYRKHEVNDEQHSAVYTYKGMGIDGPVIEEEKELALA